MCNRRLVVPAQPVGKVIKAAPSCRVVAERVEHPKGAARNSAAVRATLPAPGSAHNSSFHGPVDSIEIRWVAGDMRIGIVSGVGVAVDRLGH